MTKVFIIRPFGKKRVTVPNVQGDDTLVEVDFDKIDQDLIQAALDKNNLKGETTKLIASAGNIRVDMFKMLIAYDLVIADISIDNANVFYELGIRHGLRPNGTILIRFPTSGKDVPFDLKTDRYIAYERENLSAAVGPLAQSIKETLHVMAKGTSERRPDSPVFLLLPGLIPPDAAKLTIVPREFQEAIENAQHDEKYGATTLALLAREAKRTEWEQEALRIIGRVQRKMQMFEAAQETWESIRHSLPDDIEANLQLATIYQRLGKLIPAEQACRRVLEDNPAAEPNDFAEARSQLARNQKAIWAESFQGLATEKERRQQAISDKRLVDAFENYIKGFENDMNHYYSGINALGLLTTIVKLAEIETEKWSHLFPSSRKADNQLDDYQEQRDHLASAVKMSLENASRKAVDGRKPDEWVLPSEAQYHLLTSDNVDYVRSLYQEAKQAGGQGFSVEAEARQVLIFERLGLFPENCAAALEELGLSQTSPQVVDQAQPCGRIIIATGHRADAPGRPNPRFPNTPECIEKAKNWLKEMLLAEQAQTKGLLSAMAGAASGTDLLFHEVCAELGISTEIVLPIPKDEYRRQSVADGGGVWIVKFNQLVACKEPIILTDTDGLPTWTENLQNYSVFQRGNIWMMEYANLQPNIDTTLLALWNEKPGDGPGGTSDMVNLAKEKGLKLCSKNTSELFGLSLK
jgi:tetratricopeptide (TPR) repeat protein